MDSGSEACVGGVVKPTQNPAIAGEHWLNGISDPWILYAVR